jgi:hypothetical protein
MTATFAVLMIGFGGSAIADESIQKEEAKISPSKLPTKGGKNIKLVNTITTFDVPGTFQPPKAQRTILDLPKQIKVNTKAAKTCKTDQGGLGNAPTVAAAKKACGSKSVVSIDSGSSATVRVGGPTSATEIPIDVVAFNEDGKQLLLYSKPVGTFSGIPASILVGKLKNSSSGKNYGKALDVSIPPLAAGAISFFKVTVKNGSYLKAKCKPKKLTFQAKTFFEGGSSTADTATQKCKPKKGKKKK